MAAKGIEMPLREAELLAMRTVERNGADAKTAVPPQVMMRWQPIRRRLAGMRPAPRRNASH